MQVTSDDVLKAMGTVPSPGVSASAAHALALSRPVLESLIESKISEGERIDFFTYSGQTRTRLLQPVTFRLTSAFLSDSPVVRYAAAGFPLREEGEGEILSPDDYIVDAEKGMIHLIVAPVRGYCSYSVEYPHGFAEGEEVPDSLGSLLVQTAVCFMNIVAVTPSNRKGTNVPISGMVYRMMLSTASPFYRERLSVDFPTMSKGL